MKLAAKVTGNWEFELFEFELLLETLLKANGKLDNEERSLLKLRLACKLVVISLEVEAYWLALLSDLCEVLVACLLDLASFSLLLAKLNELSALSDSLNEWLKDSDWLIDWLKDFERLWDSCVLLEAEVDLVLSSEALILKVLLSDLLPVVSDAPLLIKSETDPTTCDFGSTEVWAAYTRPFGSRAPPVAPTPRIVARPAISFR